MKRILFTALILTGMLTVTNSRASLSFASLSGSSVEFGPGSQFNITASTTADGNFTGGFAQWDITTAGAAANLNGAFSGGPWTYGTITTSGPLQTANVAPGGTFAIDDGAGHLLSGNVNWVQVYTVGSTGGFNAGATINLTGMTYSGSNTALDALLASAGDGSMNLTFQFGTTESLTQLSQLTGHLDSQSYSGTLAPVPEPTTVLAGALLLLPLGASAFRILRRNRIG
jgi:hypothetical protein